MWTTENLKQVNNVEHKLALSVLFRDAALPPRGRKWILQLGLMKKESSFFRYSMF